MSSDPLTTIPSHGKKMLKTHYTRTFFMKVFKALFIYSCNFFLYLTLMICKVSVSVRFVVLKCMDLPMLKIVKDYCTEMRKKAAAKSSIKRVYATHFNGVNFLFNPTDFLLKVN